VARSPRYLQIAEDLRRRIKSREFAADMRCPTETRLQQEYQASRNTVRDAIKLLVQQHLLEARAGRGTFIAEDIVPFVTTLSPDPETGLGGSEETAAYPAAVREHGREAAAGTPAVQVIKCSAQIAAHLKVEENDRVVSRNHARLIDGTVWSSQTSYYPLEWVQRGAEGLLDPEDIPGGIVAYLADAIGFKEIGYRDLISARLAHDSEQELFDLTHNHTVIEIQRTSFAEDGTPIRVTVTVYPSDRNQIAYDIGTVPGSVEKADPALAMRS
jgi:GntR family transcriptional regulator